MAGQDVTEAEPELKAIFEKIHTIVGQEEIVPAETEIGSMIYAVKPGDGSAREQAASCQRVIGEEVKEISLYVADMTEDEKKIVKAGCLINYNRSRNK